MNQPPFLSTNKKWDDILPHKDVQELLKAITGKKDDLSAKNLAATDAALPGLFLFHGIAPENKMAAAALIATQLQQEAYRVDTPAIVSKYIGETEKNLDKVFRDAAAKNWLLFFDEADALFGKRTGVHDSHDKYADQETNFLLQKVENHKNLVLIATSNKTQIPSSILRRFQHVVHFPPTR